MSKYEYEYSELNRIKREYKISRL